MLDLDQFPIPEVAREAMKKQGFTEKPIDDGVSVMSGHDSGVAYRFFIHPEYNLIKSKAAKYEVFDEIEMIEWMRDKRTMPTERVRFLPEALLYFDDETGECIGGKYQDAYLRFKEGKAAAGMPLTKWNLLNDAQVATLARAGIFTIEQLAEQPRAKIEGKYPQDYVDALDRAIQWVYGQQLRESSVETADKVDELMSQNMTLMARLEELENQNKALEASKPKKRGRKKLKKD